MRTCLPSVFIIVTQQPNAAIFAVLSFSQFTNFNCYQRVDYLRTRYGRTRLQARNDLCERNQCQVPAGGVPDNIAEMVENSSYCSAPSVGPTLQPSAPLPPTPRPTCNLDSEDFNLCVAIDMSGSGMSLLATLNAAGSPAIG